MLCVLSQVIRMLSSSSFQAGIKKVPTLLLCQQHNNIESVRLSSGSPSDHRFSAKRSGKPISKQRAFQSRVCTRNARVIWRCPRAVLATDPATSKLSGKFDLEGGSQLLVTVLPSTAASPARIELAVTNGSPSLVLHWGAIKYNSSKWTLPSRFPEGTQNYKRKALRTPFTKSGDNAVVQIEIDDEAFSAIEFILYDPSGNRWFKYHGGNFHVDLPRKGSSGSGRDITIPEELVQIQAYLRWERKGKQMYTPEQEKEEYEAARKELQEEVARGLSVEELRSKLQKGDNVGGASLSAKIPEDLIQIQAYIRWEKAGKPNYSKEEQSEEYEAARKELQEEVARGLSVEELRSKLQKGDNVGGASLSAKIPEDLIQIQAYIRWEKAGKPNYSKEKQSQEFKEALKDLERELSKGVSVAELRKKLQSDDASGNIAEKIRRRTTIQRVQRKKRDVFQLINKFPGKTEVGKHSVEPRKISEFEQQLQGILPLNDESILQKKITNIGNGELLVLLSSHEGKTRVTLVTNIEQSLVLHWGLSKHADCEWLAPPTDIIPEGSNLLPLACETPLKDGFAGNPAFKFFQVEIGKTEFHGMPFVLQSDGNWIKDNGSDFYLTFKQKDSKTVKAVRDGKETVKWLLEEIAEKESDAERSLMHRFSIASTLTERAKDEGELGLAGILVWMRFMATRQLAWNKNYNVKPREISSAQDKLTDILQSIFIDQPHNREIVRMIMSSVGRGGQGDVGQRIRDEILVIQRHNDCKGGMMEEWHQKLHNNTSPDDVVICQALLDYVKSDFNIDVYWKTLNSNGVTKERLASYDRKIVSEPNFRRDQKEGLIRDLTAYMRTLKAVHSGADLESAIATCLGYSAEGHDFMGGVKIPPVQGLPPELPGILAFILDHVEDKSVCPLVEALVEARMELRPLLLKSHDRLKDLIFLDLALDSTVRTAVERGFEALNKAQPSDIVYFISMVLENLVLSSDKNEELVHCLKGWYDTLDLCKSNKDTWPLYAKAVLDRTRIALTEKAENYHRILQPSAEYLGFLLQLEEWAVNIFTEEMIRAGSAASLSLLLNRLDPTIRKIANLGSWQVISPVEVRGFVKVVDQLAKVQNEVYEQKTILVANRVKGEEEIPTGAVAVLTPDMPDVLSHVSVRARNSKVCFATCFDQNVLDDLRSKKGKGLSIQPTSSDLIYKEINDSEVTSDSGNLHHSAEPALGIKLNKKHFAGKYAISSDQFSNELVGAKSRNIGYLRGKLPSWVRVPVSVALPFGVFEKVLSEAINKNVAKKIRDLEKLIAEGDFSQLHDIRETVLELNAPPQLVAELKDTMKNANMPWPGDDGEERWQQAWKSIKKVWASKWNERAYVSTRKANIDHSDLCMAVLVQEIINADYAFVIHTTNPSTGDPSEIYAEIVKGLGETLVGAYPGRAMSFVTRKADLNHPKILGYPSKPIGLFIRPSIIFRSDSNGEDLEGYAGAGLYDSVPMDEEEVRSIDYSSDPLVVDANFQQSLLSKIAKVGHEIELLYGSPQDVEGVIKDGELYVVQTRPQM